MNKGRCQKHPEEGEGEGWSKYKGGNPTTHRCLEADLSFSVVTLKSKTIFEKFRQILKTSRKPENKIWRKLTHIWFLRNRTLFMNKPTVGQIYEWQSEGNALERSRRFDTRPRCTNLTLSWRARGLPTKCSMTRRSAASIPSQGPRLTSGDVSNLLVGLVWK